MLYHLKRLQSKIPKHSIAVGNVDKGVLNKCSLQFLGMLLRKNLVVNDKDNTVFMSRNYRSESCPVEI